MRGGAILTLGLCLAGLAGLGVVWRAGAVWPAAAAADAGAAPMIAAAAEPGLAPGTGSGTGPGTGPGADAVLGPVTNLPMPRYVSLNARRVNLRRGPGLAYRVDLEYRRRGLPVRVLDEYGHWRRVIDSAGADGWVYHALLSGRRMVEVTAAGAWVKARPVGLTGAADCADLAAAPDGTRACLSQGALAELAACERVWCLVEAGGVEGWVPKSAIWGADPAEVFGD